VATVRATRASSIGGWITSDEAVDAVFPALLVQAVLHLVAPLAVAIASGGPVGVADILGAWNQWDAPHYLTIAASGYSATANPEYIVFFPLYPALIRLGSLLADPLVVASVISIVCTVVAAVGLHRLARLDAPRAVARAAVVLMLVFPTAFAFAAPYTESLFVAAVVWSFLAARRGDWRAAGILAMVASLARLQGVFLLPALVVEYLLTRRAVDRRGLWLLLPLIGPITYLLINQAVFEDPFRFLAMQREFWFHENAMPWEVIGDLVRDVTTRGGEVDWATTYLVPLLGFGLLAVTAVWTIASRRSRPSYAVYAIVTLASLSTLTWPISVARYALGVFPVFLMLGALGRRPAVAVVFGAASAALLLALTVVFAVGGWAG
jgi:hypothetical protein